MKDIDAAKKIAVLIDAENAQHSVMAAELSKHGYLVVKKAYGDGSSEHLKTGSNHSTNSPSHPPVRCLCIGHQR